MLGSRTHQDPTHLRNRGIHGQHLSLSTHILLQSHMTGSHPPLRHDHTEKSTLLLHFSLDYRLHQLLLPLLEQPPLLENLLQLKLPHLVLQIINEERVLTDFSQ